VRLFLCLTLIALAACPARTWADGTAVLQDSRSGAIVPTTKAGVAVVRQDLEITVRVPSYRHWATAEVRADYLLENKRAAAVALPIRFPAENVVGPRLGVPPLGVKEGPAAKLDGKALAVAHQDWRAHKPIPWAEINKRWGRWGEDGLFLNPRTHRLYRLVTIGQRQSVTCFLGFTIALQPHRRQRLVVHYFQALNPNWPDDWQLTYIMKTAKHWESWGETNITIRLPRGMWQHIAIDPWPYSHVVTRRQHVYYIHLGRPDRNLHIGLDPVGRVPTPGA